MKSELVDVNHNFININLFLTQCLCYFYIFRGSQQGNSNNTKTYFKPIFSVHIEKFFHSEKCLRNIAGPSKIRYPSMGSSEL